MKSLRAAPSIKSARRVSRRGTDKQIGRVERFPSGQREQTVNLPADAYGGSNPPLSTRSEFCESGCAARAGVAQLVEREPSKLGVAGSNPVSRSILGNYGRLVTGILPT